MTTNRDKVRQVLSQEGLTAAQVAHRSGLSVKAATTILSAFVNDTKEAVAEKPEGSSYSVYKAKSKFVTYTNVRIEDLNLKLSQLRTHRDKIRASGVTFIDKIIEDYERFYTANTKPGSKSV